MEKTEETMKSAENKPMLSFENVSFKYDSDDYQMFRDLSFHVKQGEFVSIIGASGGGKTTIFRLINRFLTPAAGRILVNGRDIREERSEIGYMPQHDLLFPWRTAEANVMLPMQVHGVQKAERRARAQELLQRAGLGEVGNKYPRELSGGMRQRVAFVRTLAAGSDLLLLDEPFSALDSITRIQMQEWLRNQWKELGKTIVFITHDVEEALFLSTRVLVLTGRPADHMEEVEIPYGRDRTRDMLLDPEIMTLKQRLVQELRGEARDE